MLAKLLKRYHSRTAINELEPVIAQPPVTANDL
jgi:hypothetical protein